MHLTKAKRGWWANDTESCCNFSYCTLAKYYQNWVTVDKVVILQTAHFDSHVTRTCVSLVVDYILKAFNPKSININGDHQMLAFRAGLEGPATQNSV